MRNIGTLTPPRPLGLLSAARLAARPALELRARRFMAQTRRLQLRWPARLAMALLVAVCCFVSPLATRHSVQTEATASELPLPAGPLRVYLTSGASWTAGWDIAAVAVAGDFVAPPGAVPWSEDAVPPEPVEQPPAAPILRAGAIINGVNLTFYDCTGGGFCGRMFNGEPVYEGATACSWDLPLGTRFSIIGDPSGRVYVCKDRGLLSDTWIDVFFHAPAEGWAWQRSVGRVGAIKIVAVGENR